MVLITKEELLHDLEVYSNKLKDIAEYIDTEGNIAKNRKEYTILLNEVNKFLYFTIKKLK